MITMDVKGINWVGCVYEKFESMCLEVEENMYQDTVKFVEDQVQTVGESVKKLYADIMQDLLCDSSLDGENISACGFPIEHYSDVDNSKKSKIRKTKEHVKVGVEEVNGDSEVISLVEKDVEHTGLFHRQRMYDSCTRSSGDCAKVACSDLYSRQDHGMRSYNKKNLVVKQTPIKDRLPGANTAVGKDFNRVSLSCSEFSNENRDASCDQPDEVITPTAEGGSNDSSVHAIDSNIGVHGTEISQQSDKAKLEETCVMVSGEELHFVHHVVANCKPYKKKIPKAFTSRTSSARKQEYEQLALWHGHHTKSFLGGEDSKKSPTRDFCESEWEIL
ncbi:uncharacterized protein LOC133724869 isoform X3 [Rosa rugosa]|uniref:uncharacterized protein LOC133724869 isoform X3 n=1 Tax=Rosa rugosa TaxID=74645 RepID=UPI002B40FBFE|nr:uncharacterized protein LOC133724869 isoform X3 [Rosa rugosa]